MNSVNSEGKKRFKTQGSMKKYWNYQGGGGEVMPFDSHTNSAISDRFAYPSKNMIRSIKQASVVEC